MIYAAGIFHRNNDQPTVIQNLFNRDVSNGPLAHPLSRLLAPLTRSLARSLTRS